MTVAKVVGCAETYTFFYFIGKSIADVYKISSKASSGFFQIAPML
ncbi:MAG: hypothetical protein QS748_04425 [Candidatus Endonucleobacter bathymodioli]|uniref:Uncharacterized protein n=1 Tax=Candidatus Endonucleibacter bathymodioli TaxID=539814 RepID=A0AA90NK96_9GAMM|nr:hypothetical protein [Candidatus Endonucleobacter bathymodioli]